MTIAIIDDLIDDCKILSDLLIKYSKEKYLHMDIKKFSSGEAFLRQYVKGEYDIIFIDIYMKELNGIETARQIRTVDSSCLLVFVTSTADYALESYKVRAFDYLTKPVDYLEFSNTMALCDETLSNKSHYIEIKEGRIIVKVNINDILYTDYSNHYIQIHTNDKIFKTYMRFDDFFTLLKDYPQFLNCYRNCSVNLDAIESISEKDFIVTDGSFVPIAKEKRVEIKQIYADYVFAKLNGGF